MKKQCWNDFLRKLGVFILALGTLLNSANAQTFEVVDDAGSVISLARPAARIISLAPALTELLFSIDAGDRLSAVIEFSDFPPAALSIPRIGRHDRLDMERIIQIEPDLILAWQSGNPKGSVEKLKELGFEVFIAEAQTLEDIPQLLLRLGVLTGNNDKAKKITDEFSKKFESLRATYADKEAQSVFYQIWNTPLISVGGDELINDIIQLCGGRNIFADISLKSPKVSEEAVLARNPRIIIASGADAQRPHWLDDWKSWSELTAAAEGNLFFVPPDYVMRPTLRALEGAEMLCRQIDSVR